MTFKTLVHKKYQDSFGIIYLGEIGTSSVPHLYPITADLEGILKYSDLSDEAKEVVREDYELKIVYITVFK